MSSGTIVEIEIVLYSMVRKEGVEPSRLYSHRLLRPACLPVSPLPHNIINNF